MTLVTSSALEIGRFFAVLFQILVASFADGLAAIGNEFDHIFKQLLAKGTLQVLVDFARLKIHLF